MRKDKIEASLITIGLLFAIISMFYEKLFPLVYVVFGTIFLKRSISHYNKDNKKAIMNLFITVIFIIGIIFLLN